MYSLPVFPIETDGSLGPDVDRYRHEGSGPNRERQNEAHAHSATFDPTGSRVYVADLGIDQVKGYNLDPSSGRLHADTGASVTIEPGSGPRHMTFHPTLPLAWVINELGSTITSFRHDPRTGALTQTATVSTLPEGTTGESSCADIHVHPNGRFLYGSNRGHDSVAGFRIEPDGGRLDPAGHFGEGISWPRNFAIDPDGRIMLVANKLGDDIIAVRVDPETGVMTATGHRCAVSSPVCVLIVP